MDWYEENIEEGVRDIVKYLRNNGVNTESSCEHDNMVQCQYIPDGMIQHVHTLLYNYLEGRYGTTNEVNFDINISHKVIHGYSYSSLTIYLGT